MRTIKYLFMILFLGLMTIGCDNDPASPREGHTDADGFILEDENGNEVYREFAGASTGLITLGVGEILELSVHFLDDEGNEIEHEEEGGSDAHDHNHDHDDHGGDSDEEDGLRISENDVSIAIIETEEHEEEHCDEIANQAECEASDHCEWHADDNACEGHEEEHCDEIANQAECEASDHCEWHTDDNACEEHEEEEHHGLGIYVTGVGVGSTSFKLELMHGDHADYTSTNNVPVTVTSSN